MMRFNVHDNRFACIVDINHCRFENSMMLGIGCLINRLNYFMAMLVCMLVIGITVNAIEGLACLIIVHDYVLISLGFI